VEAVISLEGVHFDFDKSTLRPEAIVILDKAAGLLKTQAKVVVEVAGHTDSVGADQYNMGLSIRRAAAVREFMISDGVAPSMIRVSGEGETNPVASNATAAGRAENRRVDIHVGSR
jgi:outer membrane protein OmpA-like peptidoglycan-associated protein